MPVAVQVPGLEHLLRDVPDGRLVVLEGDVAPAKSHFARTLAKSAVAAGRDTALVSTRPRGHELPGLRVLAASEWPDIKAVPGRDLVVDSFSLLCAGAPLADTVTRLRALGRHARERDGIAVAVVDTGQLDAATMAAIHHLADGLMLFRAREDDDGLVPYIRVPKWMDRTAFDRNIYYGFDGQDILVDTRRRVT